MTLKMDFEGSVIKKSIINNNNNNNQNWKL